jgi:hypothetical protein
VAEFGGIANLSAGMVKAEKIEIKGINLEDSISSLSARVSQLENSSISTSRSW